MCVCVCGGGGGGGDGIVHKFIALLNIMKRVNTEKKSIECVYFVYASNSLIILALDTH